MGLWNSLKGLIHAELTSADISGMLSAANAHGITLLNLEYKDDLTVHFCIVRKEYAKFRLICENRGETLRIIKRRGVYWTGANLMKRPILLTGLFIVLVAVFFLPKRILFVRVEGNETIPENRILEAADVCGIRFGASSRRVRSEKVKNALLSEIPDLQWAGVNTFGCVAVISIRERGEEKDKASFHGVSNIVAERDGVVLDYTVTRGNGLCDRGQAVEEGQVLISGYIDCGLYVLAARAEGEVFARTVRKLDAVTPSEYQSIGETMEAKKKISILIGKKRINLWKDSGIWDSSCGRMYEEYYITLPGRFSLPIALAVETYRIREITDTVMTEEDACLVLTDFASQYLKTQMVAGSVLQKEEKCVLENEKYCLQGSYLCTEMIGREQQEKIGEYYGKDN